MSVVTLTFEKYGEEEITSGIPRYVNIYSNVPSTIYYTLDGTTPTYSSKIYIDPEPGLELPSGMTSVTLSAFGDDNTGAGPILTQTFSADMTKITISRYVGMEGIVLNRADLGPDTVDRYGYSDDGSSWETMPGAPATFLDVDPEFLDVVRKEKGINGIEEGTQIDVGYPDPDSALAFDEDAFIPFCTTEKAKFFNPNAKMILIDNRLENEVNPVLRGYGSFSNIYGEFGGKRVREVADDAAYVSGGFVRRFYDVKNNIAVSYYFDHNEAKYVKSIQSLPSDIKQNMSTGTQIVRGPPLVFKWIYRGRQSSI